MSRTRQMKTGLLVASLGVLLALLVSCTPGQDTDVVMLLTPRPPTRVPDPTATVPPTYAWERFDVDITVRTNGDLHVVERQRLHFSGRPFTYGYRNIPRDATGGEFAITDVIVRQPNVEYTPAHTRESYTFLVDEIAEAIIIGWFFPESIGSQSYEFEYTVRNGVQSDGAGDYVQWKAMPANLDAVIEAGQVTVTLPPGGQVISTQALFDGVEAPGAVETTVSAEQQRVTFTLNEVRPAGVDVAVAVRFPGGIVQQGRREPFRALVEPDMEMPPAEKGYAPAAVEFYCHGIDYFLEGQLNQAIGEFTRAINRERAFPEAYYYRGLAYLSQGLRESDADNLPVLMEIAIADFDQALLFDPFQAETYYFRGLAYRAMGDGEQFVADTGRALTLDPAVQVRLDSVVAELFAGIGGANE